MGENWMEEDLFSITDCIINSDNPKLQIANFSSSLIKLQANCIIGYMQLVNVLSREEELSDNQKEELKAKVELISSMEKKEKAIGDRLDMSYSMAPEGGPKLWDNLGPDIIPQKQLLSEVDFYPKLDPEEHSRLEDIVVKNYAAFGLDGRLGTHDAQVPIKLKDESAPPNLNCSLHCLPCKEGGNWQTSGWLVTLGSYWGVFQPSGSPCHCGLPEWQTLSLCWLPLAEQPGYSWWVPPPRTNWNTQCLTRLTVLNNPWHTGQLNSVECWRGGSS